MINEFIDTIDCNKDRIHSMPVDRLYASCKFQEYNINTAGYKNFSNAEIGFIAESILKRKLEQMNINHKWIGEKKQSKYDFEILGMKVDVKCRGINVLHILPHYEVDIRADTKETSKEYFSDIDYFLFSFFYPDTKDVEFVGFFLESQVQEKARYIKIGEKLSSGIVSNHNLYRLKVSQLIPFNDWIKARV